MSVSKKVFVGQQHREVESTKTKAFLDFEKYVKPVLENHFSGTIYTDMMMSSDGKVLETMAGQSADRWSGRDGHVEIRKNGRFGARYNLSFAHRLQWSTFYNSFSLREWKKQASADDYETEVAKMVDGWRFGYDRPQLLIQSFLKQDGSLSIGIAKYDDIAKFLAKRVLTNKEESGQGKWERKEVWKYGTKLATFISLPWVYLQEKGVDVEVIAPVPVQVAV